MLLLGGLGSVHDASALNETRTLSFHHTHSGEDLTVTFKRDGRYDEEALKQLNHFLRDWRTQDQTTMDRHLFDIIWEVYRDVDGKKPIQIISAYRSPATNAMLRRRSAHTGVARFSQHMLGHAMDFYIPDVPLEQIRYAGLRLQRGGVGFYPTSGSPFVHLDTGNIRHWPRMTHDQLARVFPDGRTVHIPTDGAPLKGYELARADIERRGDGDDAATVSRPSLLARLFGASRRTTRTKVPRRPFRTRPHRPQDRRRQDRDHPYRARTKPAAATLQLAAADAQIVQAAKPKQPAASDNRLRPSRRPRRTSSMRAASGMTCRPHRCRRRRHRSPPSMPARPPASTDQQPTGSVPAAYEAMAYAPERPLRSITHTSLPPAAAARAPGSASRNSMAATRVARGQGQEGVVAASTRIVASSAQRCMDANHDAGAERQHVDVGYDARRRQYDLAEPALCQTADCDRDGLLGRSASRPDHRPL